MPHFLGSKEPLQYLGVPETNPPDIFERDRDPLVTDDSTLYNIGDLWINTVTNTAFLLTDRAENAAIWIMLGGAGGAVQSLTGDIGAAVLPAAGNINIQGGGSGAISFSNGGAGQMDALVLVDGITVVISGNTLTAPGGITSFPVDLGGPGVPALGAMSLFGTAASATDFSNSSGIETHVGVTTDQIYIENRRFVSAFIVDSSLTIGLRGEYSTITAAVTAAALAGGGDVYIRRGTYVESFTLPAGVTLNGLTAGSELFIVNIQGTIVFNAAGVYGMRDITVNPAVGPALTVTSATLVDLDNVTFNPTAGIGVQFQAAASTSLCKQCSFRAPADAVQVTTGTLTLEGCLVDGEIDSSGIAFLFLNDTTIDGRTSLTGTTTVTSSFCTHAAAALEAFDVGAGTTLNLLHASVGSSAAGGNWVIGTGTINYADVVINGSATGLFAGLTVTNPDWKPYGDVVGVVGVNSYNPLHFSVNSTTGQVSLIGGGIAADQFTVDSISGTGVNPVVPDGAGNVTITGAQVAASAFANVININSNVPNQYEVQIQRSSAVIASDVTINGVSHFDNTQFTVDANGFVQTIASAVFSWLDFAGGALATNTGYFATAAAVYTLPTGAANGETVEIVDVVGGGVVLTAPGVQIIQLQADTSSPGGTVTSTALGDALRLKFRLADVTWYQCPGAGGNWN